MRGYLYYIFPVKVTDYECEDIDCWQWKYFEWLFYIIKWLMESACFLTNTEPQFLIYIPKK